MQLNINDKIIIKKGEDFYYYKIMKKQNSKFEKIMPNDNSWIVLEGKNNLGDSLVLIAKSCGKLEKK